MRQIEEVQNLNMAEGFNPLLINVLDKSMMKWFKKYAPGFMCVGRKPQPFGNKMHSVCCGLTSILWRAQITESKYLPQNLVQKDYD